MLVIVFLTFLDVSAEKPEGNFWRNVLRLIRLIDVDIFMTMMLVLGTCWGFLEAYLFIFLKELNATNYLLGNAPLNQLRVNFNHFCFRVELSRTTFVHSIFYG